MKTMRKKWLIPMLVFTLAIGGAFATNVKAETASIPVDGYLSILSPCDTEVDCDTEGQEACTVPEFPDEVAFGKMSPNDPTCPIPLFRPVN